MKPQWILERDVFGENLERFHKEIVRQGMECRTIYYVPFDEADQFLEGHAAIAGCVVAYGSLQFGQAIQNAGLWNPGVWLNIPQLDCRFYYPRLGPHLLNQNYVMLSFGELSRRKEWLLEYVGRSGCVFVRPTSCLKSFSGKVITTETWDDDVRLLGFYDVPWEELVVVAEPANIAREWRFVVGGTADEAQRIIASSSYKEVATHQVSTPGAPGRVESFVEEILTTIDYRPDPVWTLDVCETRDGDLRVLEVGSFSCSGLYACDVEAVVREVSRIAGSGGGAAGTAIPADETFGRDRG